MTLIATNYVDLTVKLKLLAQISNVYRLTRIGRILLSLIKDKHSGDVNPFFLREEERIFYIYQLLRHDADNLLTVVELVQSTGNSTREQLQEGFQLTFLNRLKAKISASAHDRITRRLLERHIEVETTWKNPKVYAAYIALPRVHWLLDLGLFHSAKEKNSIVYHLTEAGQRFVASLPKLPTSDKVVVTDSWLNTDFFSEVCPLVVSADNFQQWQDADDTVHLEACEKYLPIAFGEFRRTGIPKISLTQGVMYLCLRFGTELHLLTNPKELIQWFQEPRILGDYRYEARTAARENEAYFVRMHS